MRVLTVALAVFSALAVLASSAPPSVAGQAAKKPVWVAYDVKDNKYYSVDYAKAHNMHDHGGDPLVIRRMADLPKSAKLSHAMHGHL